MKPNCKRLCSILQGPHWMTECEYHGELSWYCEQTQERWTVVVKDGIAYTKVDDGAPV